jgi:hypothetical protein
MKGAQGAVGSNLGQNTQIKAICTLCLPHSAATATFDPLKLHFVVSVWGVA